MLSRHRLAACTCIGSLLLLLGMVGGLTPGTAGAATCGGSGPYYGTVCADSPVAFYPLADSGAGTMTDISGNGHDGTYGGPSGATTDLTFGQAGPLSNTNTPNAGVASKAATVGTVASANSGFLPAGNSARTVEAWFKATSNTVVSARYPLVAWGTDNTSNPYGLIVEQNDVVVDHYGGAETFSTTADIFDGSWHFVALTYDGSVDTAYLDGQQVGAPQPPSNAPLNTVVPSPLLIGDWVDHYVNSPLAGAEADAAIFSSVLTPAEIAAQYAAAGVAPTVVIRGSVQDPTGNLIANAPLQACPPTGPCILGSTDQMGHFTVAVPAPASGTLAYTLTAYPPSFGSGSDFDPGSFGPVTVSASAGASDVTIVLQPSPGLPPGVTMVSPNFGTESSSTTNPVTFWGAPFQVCASPASLGVQPGGAATITSVLVTGVNAGTAQPETIEFPAGGSVNGLNEPIGPASSTSPPLCVTIPALQPYDLHGSVQFHFQGQLYPDVSQETPVTGIAAPQILDFSADPPDNVRDAFIVNTQDLDGIDVGGSGNEIVGGDSADFKIVPLSHVPSSVSDCGTSQAFLLQSALLTGTTPSAGSQCAVEVEWTPPDNVASGMSTLELQVGNSHLAIELLGCNDKLTKCDIEPPDEPEDEEPKPVPAPPPAPQPPAPNPQPNPNPPVVPHGYIDPSGTVQAQVGTGSPQPLAGATVTLLNGAASSGPFSAVPNGSAIMSPANRQNPSTTDALGSFGWDTLAGYYEINAADGAYGCTPTTTPAFAVPPPQTNLNLTLSCSSLPARASTSVGLTTSASKVKLGQGVTLTASLTPAGATGIVEFLDGSTVLGQSVIDSGVAKLTVSDLSAGGHSISASYSGDANDQPGSSSSVSISVTTPSLNLSKTNLSGRDLSGYDLAGANLKFTNLSGADLSGADLANANLTGANLKGANLSGANLSGAIMVFTNLSDANLSNANLSRAHLILADLNGANLSGANFNGAKIVGIIGVPLNPPKSWRSR